MNDLDDDPGTPPTALGWLILAALCVIILVAFGVVGSIDFADVQRLACSR